MVFADMRYLCLYLCLFIIITLIPTCNVPPKDNFNLETPVSFDLLKDHDMSTPAEVSEDKLPTPNNYVIRTRIVIEYIVFSKDDCEDTFVTMYGATPSEIYKDFEEAEKVFAEMKIQFDVDEIVFREYEVGIIQFFVDAMKYPDTMSVYYILPHVFFPYAGLSSAPWETIPQGILLSGARNELTLAHEIGHYFGLLHTFQDDDYCDDTPKQPNRTCEGDEINKFPNCGNVMNYCIHNARNITKDQLYRARRFLRATRSNHLKKNVIGDRAKIEAMYNEILEIAVPNYESLNGPSHTNKDAETVPDHSE